MDRSFSGWQKKARDFEAAAHDILSGHEGASGSRVIKLSQAYNELRGLNVRQEGLMREALKCAEYGMNRAAYVLAWAACIDFVKEKLSSDGLAKLRAARPNWPQDKGINELSERFPERQFIDVLKNVGLAGRNDVNGLISLLQRRNECAHPTGYIPSVNETLGYISEIMQRISRISIKTY